MFELQNSQPQQAEDLELQAGPKESTVLVQMNPRLGFVRKVYGILCYQLLITTFICFLSMKVPSFLKFQVENYWLFVATTVVCLFILCLLMCVKKYSRQVPINYILLTIFTLCEAYTVSMICGFSDPTIVVMAAAMTLGITLGLTIYAYTTKRDFSVIGSFMFMVLSSFLLTFLFFMFFSYEASYVLFSWVGAFIYGIYIIYDTQLILGGRHEELGMDDYILGAIIIYVDIIALFLRILQILNSVKK